MAPVYRVPPAAKQSLAAAAFLAVVVAIGNEPWLALAMMALAVPLIAFAMLRIPLRHSMLGLMFFTLTLPNPNEGFPWQPWTAPFEKVGWLLVAHWNTIDRSMSWLSPAIFSGLDLFFLTLGFVIYRRRKRRSQLDYWGAVPAPEPMRRLARLSLLTTALVWCVGLATGGNFGMSLWQVNTVVYLPVVFLLFQEAIRGPQDFGSILRVLCAAALYRAGFAWLVVNVISDRDDLPYATSHADSMLFADALVALVVLVVERIIGSRSWKKLWIAPFLVLGMLANNRRLVWVHVGIALLVVYFVTDDNPVKRRIRRTIYAAIPVAAVYVAAGWNVQYGSLFAPVRTLRSIVEPTTDRTGSSYWREIEDYNLVQTLFDNPILGTGYGHGFKEVVPLPEVPYLLERYCPHNSILGLWAYSGYFGYAGVTLLWGVAVFYAMRAYRGSRDPVIRSGALMSIVGIVVYVMHSWGDLGLGTWTGVFTSAASLAVAGKAAEAAARSTAQAAAVRGRGQG